MHRVHAWGLALVFVTIHGGCSSSPSGSSSDGDGGSGGGASSSSSSSSTGGGSTGGGNTGGGNTGGGSASSSSSGGEQGGAGGEAPAQQGCASGKYILCEDFEGTDAGGIPQGWTKHGDAIAVADDQAASGNRSLKMGPVPNGERRIYHDASQLGSGHWGRIRYRVQLPVPDAFVHSTLVALQGVGPTTGPQEVRVVDTVKEDKDGWDNDGNGSHIQYIYNVQPSGAEFGKASTYDWYYEDRWHCVEWHIDGPTQSYDFYLDGERLDQISIANGPGNYEGSQIPDAFSEVRIGWNNYQSAPPGFTAWIDDVALDDERIGCEE
ncbi:MULTISPECIES: hypothetical protein [Sorangium]|uniref:GH16 domain-containing protein n=1 Tax=Sorangium cellulosum TaxID=56 RepID=A0A4P2R295_SORCE|nr:MULTISPECIES: hypothetical protein [Sorangium]AUX36806.1 uncharacterized protein SOCE836_090230 [Sorangium cellulosum]WCQ96102.1 hypothetical protein NQZ70_08886 [Sorangium sp. Soce836]